MDTKEILFALSEAPGITGAEGEAAAVACKMLSEYMTVRTDALGNVIGEANGDGDGVLLDAHLDQIGMIVTSVTEEGFLKVGKCGGIDLRTLASAEVLVYGKKPVYGVVVSTPPHLSGGENEAPKLEDVSIDIGMTAEQAKALISTGCRVRFLSKPRTMLSDLVCGGAMDDRAGIAAILRALELLKEKGIHRKMTVVFTVQEEVTGGGAMTAAFQSDDAVAIAVDVSFATAPGVTAEQGKPLGKGTLIGYAPALDYALSEQLKSLAKENDIAWQVEAMSGRTGTNAEDYGASRCGKKTALLSIPIRNMHTAVEVVNVRDIESTAHLLAAFIEKGGVSND